MSHHLECEVLVVGGGPVGLMAALVLTEQGAKVAVVDQDQRVAQRSYALALHPGSLDLMRRLGLADRLLAAGRRVESMAFYEGSERRAAVDFTSLPGPHPYLLVVRQSDLEKALAEDLARRGVKVNWSHRLQSIVRRGEQVEAVVARLDQVAAGYPVARTEWVVMETETVRPRFVFGADGWDSTVRRVSDIDLDDLGGGIVASVFEIEADGDLPPEARVIMDARHLGVYWPLESGRCRWSFQIAAASQHEPTRDRLGELLAERAPWFQARPKQIYWTTLAQFDRKVARSFGRGPVYLAGDAAHLTTPVGVHSMNVGLREASDLADGMVRVLRQGAPPATLAQISESHRAGWLRLLGQDGVNPRPGADPWVAAHAARILPCLPGSGNALEALLKQVGLSVASAG